MADRVDGGGRTLLRWILVVLCVGGGALALAYVALSAWSRNQISEPEVVVALQSAEFARQGTLYYSLAAYPYTVCAYMPVFYSLVAGLVKAGIPALEAGRSISFLALAGLVAVVWRIVRRYTGEANCALLAAGLALCTQLLMAWGTTGQVDTLAVCFTLMGFSEYVRFEKENRTEALTWAALWALAGLFTKQTALAAPMAIFTLLLMRNWRLAMRYAAIVAVGGGLLVLAINWWLDGRFLTNTVFANMNPLAAEKWEQHASYFFTMFGPLLFVIAVGLKRAVRAGLGAPFLYLGFSFLMLAVTCGKIGSDSNYQLETAALVIICASVALYSLDFFPQFYRRSAALVTLLILPVGVYAANNVRLASFDLAGRLAGEKMRESELGQVRPYLGRGRVLSVDLNVLLRTGRDLEVETLIYRMLYDAGRMDPGRLLADLDGGAFETVILFDDVTGPPPEEPEIASLPEVQREAIRQHYRLAKHITAPASLYIYHPAAQEAGL